MNVFFNKNVITANDVVITKVIQGSNTFNIIDACPSIVSFIDGANHPQYGDSYPSKGDINYHTNGSFSRTCILSNGQTAVYRGSCSPSGDRYITIGPDTYSFAYGQYWP